MKNLYTILLLIITSTQTIIGQSVFDSQLQALAEKVALQIAAKGKEKVAVWHFVNTKGEITNSGKYIAEDFSVYFTNASKDAYQVMDRNHLDQILKEHKLNSEGFIDPETAKELGRLNAVDAIITGTVDILDTQLKVRVKVLDTETALQIAAEIGYLPIDANMASFLGVPGMGSDNSLSRNESNRGFNHPLNSNEEINNPETVSKECESKNIGDYCFANSTNVKLRVQPTFDSRYFTTFTLDPGQTQCLYNLLATTYSYEIYDTQARGMKAQGEILVVKCTSKTFTIK